MKLVQLKLWCVRPGPHTVIPGPSCLAFPSQQLTGVHSFSLTLSTFQTNVSGCVIWLCSSADLHPVPQSTTGWRPGNPPPPPPQNFMLLSCFWVFNKYLFSLITSGHSLNKSVTVLTSSLHSKTINKYIK